MGMVEECHPSYDLWQLMFSTADTGHGGTKRDRTYVIGSHVDKTSCLYDPWEMKDIIADRMRSKVRTLPSDYFLAEQVEVDREAIQLADRRKVSIDLRKPSNRADLTFLLNSREKAALNDYMNLYEQEYGKPAQSDPDLIVFLGDNPKRWRTWSAKSRTISTFRRNVKSSLFWSPHLKRFMVAREKLAALAWPVTPCMAKAMCCDMVPARDIFRAADLAGNGMHFTTVAIAQLLALACFRPMD